LTAEFVFVAAIIGLLAGWLADGAAFVGAVVLIYTQRMTWHKKA